MNREVVVTALGTAGAHGCGRASLERALAAGAPPPAIEVDRGAGYHRPGGARRALLTPVAALAPWLPAAEARRMGPPSRLAVAATRTALADAGLDPALLAGPGTAVVLSTAFGPCSFSEALLRQVLRDGPEAASPYLFTESVANAPAAQIAIACGARGANVTLCQREAGPLLAVARGAAEVAAGSAERALVGAVDEMSPLLHALLDRFGALARGRSRPARGTRRAHAPEDPGGCGEIGRPFDRRRDGVVAADGATVLLLESAAAAARAGRVPLARICGWGSAFDPSAPPTGWGGGGELLGRALRRLLVRRGAAPEIDQPGGSSPLGPLGAGHGAVGAIDRIVSGASGSRAGDRLEASVLRAAWGAAPLPPVLAPKGVTGEYGGGFLAAAVLAAAVAGVAAAPTAGFGESDPDLGVSPHDGSPLPPPRVLLASSLAAGGAAAWVILGCP
ncbi:MAG TPA: beta-ketoacyl synthase N-terminal-like domain-containing protein [Thermoanaerobaculia bacterium]|nr:beta-ketoacyl synthase N-terminal-like domain-containing protein [Thermoanaerobaculia bacterium]